MEPKYIKRISEKLNLGSKQINNVQQMHAEGATIPFMARYRKEATGNLDEVVIGNVIEEIKYFDDTDTLLMVFNSQPVVAIEDVNDQMIVDLDETGKPVALTIEHASTFMDVNAFSFQHVHGNQHLPVTA